MCLQNCSSVKFLMLTGMLASASQLDCKAMGRLGLINQDLFMQIVRGLILEGRQAAGGHLILWEMFC